MAAPPNEQGRRNKSSDAFSRNANSTKRWKVQKGIISILRISLGAAELAKKRAPPGKRFLQYATPGAFRRKRKTQIRHYLGKCHFLSRSKQSAAEMQKRKGGRGAQQKCKKGNAKQERPHILKDNPTCSDLSENTRMAAGDTGTAGKMRDATPARPTRLGSIRRPNFCKMTNAAAPYIFEVFLQPAAALPVQLFFLSCYRLPGPFWIFSHP